MGIQQEYVIRCGAGIWLISILLVIFTWLAQSQAQETFHYADVSMGTVVRLTLIADAEEVAGLAASKALTRIRKLAKDYDHRPAAASISRINAAAGIQPVPVTVGAFDLIKRALEFCDKTGGVFDITIGAVTITPGYYAGYYEEKKSLVNYRLVQLDAQKRTVFLPKEGMALDLGGMAKGTIIDSAVAVLKREGIQSGIVEAGGDFFCFGKKGWKVGIQHPRQNALLGIVVISEKGVCGSGDYYQYIVKEESGKKKRMHHIINPQKSRSAEKSAGVTVIAPTAELADIVATTLFILGHEKGQDFLEKEFPGLAALWVLPDLKIVKTDNFPTLLTEYQFREPVQDDNEIYHLDKQGNTRR